MLNLTAKKNLEMAAQFEVGAPSKTFYRLANRLISVETADEWAARAAKEFIEGFRLTPLAENAGGFADCTIELLTQDPPGIPPGLQKFELPQGVCFTDGQSYHLDIEGSRIAVSPSASRRVGVWLGRTPKARSLLPRFNLFSHALHIALRRCALYNLHAGGVVEPESGAGVLLVGESKSGKTSLTIRLALSGWPYLSDDSLIFYENAERIEAQGLRRVFSVSAPSLPRSDSPRLEEALGAPTHVDPQKRRFDPSVAFPGGLAESCVPKVCYFPTITGKRESRMEEIGQSDLLIRLIGMCPWASFDPALAGQNLRAISRLVKQVRAYTLYAGLDIHDDPAYAAALLAAHING